MKKNMLVPVSVGIAILGCVLAVSANVTTGKIHQNLEQERYKRMLAEQDLLKADQTLQQMQTELSDSRRKIDTIQKIVNDGKSDNSSLRTQMDNLSKEKESLRQQVEQLQAQTIAPSTTSEKAN